MINTLNSAKATHLQDDYYRLQKNSDMRELNNLLGHDYQKVIVKFEELKNYAKNSYTTLQYLKMIAEPPERQGFSYHFLFHK